MQHSWVVVVHLDNLIYILVLYFHYCHTLSLLFPCVHSFVSVLNVKSLTVFQCKCAQYWPDQGCWTYGNIRVSVEDTMVLVDYTIRKFCIQQVIFY